MNEPKNIGAIVRDAYEAAGIPRSPIPQHKAEPVAPDNRPDTEFSWLGRWQDIGWSIRIEPRLTGEEWAAHGTRADESWDAQAQNYSPVKSLELLHDLFPTHELRLVWPRCGYRIPMGKRASGGQYFSVCNAQAEHTEVHTRDVTGAKVGIARCDRHQGQL